MMELQFRTVRMGAFGDLVNSLGWVVNLRKIGSERERKRMLHGREQVNSSVDGRAQMEAICTEREIERERDGNKNHCLWKREKMAPFFMKEN